MNRYVKSVIKYLIKVLVTVLVISVVLSVLSMYFDLILSELFTYAGIICFVCGIFSVAGRTNVGTDPNYFQANSLTGKSLNENYMKDFKFRDKNLNFLVFMVIVGALLFLITFILTNYNL